MADLIYGKAQEADLVKRFLPAVVPFSDCVLISDMSEWEAVKADFTHPQWQHDLPLGTPCETIQHCGNTDLRELSEFLDKARAVHPDSKVLIFEAKGYTETRCFHDGGFSFCFELGKAVTLKFVGKGFDEYDLAQGKALHEAYQIPWDEDFLAEGAAKLSKYSYLKQKLSLEEYQAQRERRVNFLMEVINTSRDAASFCVPETYTHLSLEILRDGLQNIVLPLVRQQNALERDGLTIFTVYGNIVRKRHQPWGISRP